MLHALLLVLALASGPPQRPDATLTPGDVATTDARVICVAGYAGRTRDVSLKTKRAVYAAYGLTPAGRFRTSKAGARVWHSDFEVDHLIALEIGGSNRPSNLWVESYLSQPYNADMKDILERRLHALVCGGQLPLKQAQTEIATDWIAAYHRYVKP